MSADQRAGDSWSLPPGSGEISADGEFVRVHWYPTRGTHKKAKFEVVQGQYAVLRFTQTICVRQRGESRAQTNRNAVVDDVPEAQLAILRNRGFEPVDELFGEEVA